MARFYIAEMVLAINSIHSLRYVHRDIKPDNVLLQRNGHIVLADFGSCLKLLEDGTVKSSVAVGTPDYISPEILRAMEDGHGRYGPECDWWSLGVCMYEMLYGETPFYAESLVETYGKIMNHKAHLHFPDDITDVSTQAQDLISRLICNQEVRFGQNGLQDFMNHPFFEGIDWDNIQETEAPYIPEVSSATDTSNFDVDDTDFRPSDAVPPNSHSAFTGHHLPFVGFTFTKESLLSDMGNLSEAGLAGNDQAMDSLTSQAYERRIQKLDRENKELSRKLQDATRTIQNRHTTNEAPGSPAIGKTNEMEMRRLKEEIAALKNKISDSQVESNSMERDLHEALAIKKELETMEGDKVARLKTIEKSNKILKTEKEDMQREMNSLQEKYKAQTKELKDALAQRKLAMDEFTEINERLAELRSQKQKLSRQVRDREEELEDNRQRTENLKQDLRKSEKAKREVQSLLEEAQSEASKERKLRERGEMFAQELEQELEIMKSRSIGRSGNKTSQDVSQEVNRLKAELERSNVQYEENIAMLQSRHTTEIKSLNGQVQEAETKMQEYIEELNTVHNRLDNISKDSASEYQETINQLNRKHDREKQTLLEDNKKIYSDLESTQRNLEQLEEEKRMMEDEMRDVHDKKDAVAQWEAQITELIQWVSDEKDARGYLQALASKMTEELESLKMSGVPAAEKTWKNRRSQRLDKMELLNLQSSLKSEIEAKQSISEELTKTKASHIAAEKRLQEAEYELEQNRVEMEKMQADIKELRSKVDQNDSLFDRPDSQSSFMRFIREQAQRLEDSPSESEHGEDEDDALSEHSSSIGQRPATLGSPSRVSIQSYESEDSLQRDGYYDEHPPPPTHKPPPPPQQTSYEERIYANDGVPQISVVRPTQQPKSHRFAIRSFITPIKCSHCTSLMIGLQRQGTVCEDCAYSCHVACAEKAPSACPVPLDQTKRPLGINPTKGIGTAYEGYVKVPKMGGIKKGWARQFVVVCDFKLFLYDINPERDGRAGVVVSQVLDMRDEDFSVSSVLASDVIHASRKDIPCIFRVSTSEMQGTQHSVLMLADTENEKQRWVGALTELHKILWKNKLPNKAVFKAKQLYDNSLPLLKNILCTAILDSERILVGTEDGLHAVEILNYVITKIGERKCVYQIANIHDEQLVAVISGKQRHVRLYPVAAVDGYEVESVKLMDSKGTSTFCWGLVRQGSSVCLCAAIKKTVLVFELTRTKQRHRKIKEILCPGNVQFVEMMNERLCVGYPSMFAIYSVQGEGAPLSLISTDDSTLKFLYQNPIDALQAVEISHREFLLVFSTLGFYVDSSGKRSRVQEIMWPAVPHSVTYNAPYLIIYTENAAFVYDVTTAEWIQTLNLKKIRPLCREGILGCMQILEAPYMVYLRDITKAEDVIKTPDLNSKSRSFSRSKRRFSFKSLVDEKQAGKAVERRSRVISKPSDFRVVSHIGPNQGMELLGEPAQNSQERRSRLISGPSNFSHITHMGPGEGMKMLVDLPKVQGGGQTIERMERVKSFMTTLGQRGAAPGTRPPTAPRPASVQGGVNGSAVLRRDQSNSSVSSSVSKQSSVTSTSTDPSFDQSQSNLQLIPSPIYEGGLSPSPSDMEGSPQLSMTDTSSEGSNRHSYLDESTPSQSSEL
ncbi:unnamed protein product [Owenia fusiformis]|uniref:non-specific serine/threonine protein kinase n=1 Tax=Owenia fusiformis TaxID=6347 RepID=A0A8S4PB87_OWEFU|nr:unnamed protein product [Owenia fusiformis]